ncbi:hypothetical protein [Halobaculum magnesiiphilum]|uniref:Uncharacterized protein n=1 Tax=Halobaculum magnesiiphilum TaxID=1017351 RepID=A0A8T8WIJ5_9EURY|nr:hypothetical protein [Halobaculum magnesiiphilum]QZP39702.1 hypothetical protein K6T50_17130 [Halobaculum magnesiiphilum]
MAGFGLAIGYAGLLGAVVAAHNAPATAYELSLYAETPVAVWVGFGVAAVAGLFIALSTRPESRIHHASLGLIGLSALTLTAMPILRGYRFYGAGDSLTHLGWAREIAAGSLPATDLLYPGIHTFSVAITMLTGVPLSRAMLYVTLVAFPLVFLVTVPLIVKLVADTPWAYSFGLVTAAMFVPINNISVHPVAHPTSQAILLVPLWILVTLAYTYRLDTDSVVSPVGEDTSSSTGAITDGGWRSGPTATGVVMVVVSGALVLYHPQQALNVAMVLAAIAVVQLVLSWLRPGSAFTGHRWLGVQAVIVTVLFLLWVPRFERAVGTIRFTLGSFFTGQTAAGTVVAAKSTSLTALGGSLLTLSTRLFLAGAVLSLIAALLVFAVLLGRVERSLTDTSVRYLTVALVPPFLVFLLVFAIGAGDMYLRYQGFIMVFITVLGATGISLAVDRLDASVKPGTGRALALVLLLILSPVAVMGYHTSPYMYQPTSHVTESQLDGYSASFEHRGEGIEFTGLRGGPERYVDYYYGSQRARTTLNFPGYSDRITPDVFNGGAYRSTYDEPRYLGITQSEYEREVVLYDELRYSQRGFEQLETTPTVNRIRTNSGFSLYYILSDSAEPPSDDGGTD